jgi:hypothetical protein
MKCSVSESPPLREQIPNVLNAACSSSGREHSERISSHSKFKCIYECRVAILIFQIDEFWSMEGTELESTPYSRSQVAATSVVIELTCAHKRNFDSSLIYNKLNTGIGPTYFRYMTRLICQMSCYQISAFLYPYKTAEILGKLQVAASCSHSRSGHMSPSEWKNVANS